MDRLEIPVKKETPFNRAYLAIASLGAMAYLAVSTIQVKKLTSVSTTFDFALGWLLLIVCIWFAIAVVVKFLENKKCYLVASKPPQFVTERIWFGKFAITRMRRMEGAAWVRVISESYDWFHTLSVEVGSNGYIATRVYRWGYSEEEIVTCKNICTRIANFLKLEDRGYVHYDVNGKKSA